MILQYNKDELNRFVAIKKEMHINNELCAKPRHPKIDHAPITKFYTSQDFPPAFSSAKD